LAYKHNFPFQSYDKFGPKCTRQETTHHKTHVTNYFNMTSRGNQPRRRLFKSTLNGTREVSFNIAVMRKYPPHLASTSKKG